MLSCKDVVVYTEIENYIEIEWNTGGNKAT